MKYEFKRVVDWWKRFKAKENLCFYCGVLMVSTNRTPHPPNLATKDHIRPKSLQTRKSRQPSNFLTACLQCNERKSNYEVDEFRKILTGRGDGLFFGEICYEKRERKSILPQVERPNYGKTLLPQNRDATCNESAN